MENARGFVAKLSGDGLGYLQEEYSGRLYVFTLDALPGYAGQPLEEIGLRAGSAVEFSLRGDRVTELRLRAANRSAC